MDSLGRVRDVVEIVEPVAGQDLVTTIDLDLQLAAEEQLRNSPSPHQQLAHFMMCTLRNWIRGIKCRNRLRRVQVKTQRGSLSSLFTAKLQRLI